VEHDRRALRGLKFVAHTRTEDNGILPVDGHGKLVCHHCETIGRLQSLDESGYLIKLGLGTPRRGVCLRTCNDDQTNGNYDERKVRTALPCLVCPSPYPDETLECRGRTAWLLNLDRSNVTALPAALRTAQSSRKYSAPLHRKRLTRARLQQICQPSSPSRACSSGDGSAGN